MCESKGEPWTGAGKGESDAVEHQNKDHPTEEPLTLDGDPIDVCGLVLDRSAVQASARPRAYEAQPDLLPALRISIGSA
jgi:hypothetical protein